MDHEILYDIRCVTKIYPRQRTPANRDVSLSIRQGEIFGLLGDNGAGKTTLVRQMAGLLAPTEGTITLLGQDVTRNPAHVPRYVGYMPQEARALTNLTVSESLTYTARLRGLGPNASRRERERLLDLWQVESLRNKVTARLSGGERRLLRLAVAMVADPPVLILDEPTNDLAPQRRRLVWDVLRQVNRDLGTTVIFITHDAMEAERAIQRVGIMRSGELLAVGAPADLKHQVDRKLRLELFFRPEHPPSLPESLPHQEIQPGRWLAWIDRGAANQILSQIDLSRLEDFRLVSATLEDLYVHYINS